jgi:hypothetical protein
MFFPLFLQTLPRSQAEIARAAGVTEVTVRNRSKELRKKLGMSLGRLLSSQERRFFYLINRISLNTIWCLEKSRCALYDPKSE